MNNTFNSRNTHENQPIERIGLDYFENEASPEDMYGRGEPMTDGLRVVYSGAPDSGLFHWMKKHDIPNAKILCDGGAIIAARTLDYEELRDAVEEVRARGEAHWVVGIEVDEVDQFVVYRADLGLQDHVMANKNIVHALEVLNIGGELHGILSVATPVSDVDIVSNEVAVGNVC